ncbi:uncharacterized protein LOC111395872 [Olea europaea var. sylvestris]|uniref:Uncharacterized protein n=1 Tax=Olea europaea subsp. europaea TaxID=158383 RepID=A0A8S0S429_OLEEU|nr:uncharacterized protein LOC111395872 [Olea europaea var. sylvestris]CAA2986163.1 Hypothetical predicted protein [Olea europaea subsp. europaea]
MSSRARRKQIWCVQPLTPLMEGPDFSMQNQEASKKESSWEVIREWFRVQKSVPGSNNYSMSVYGNNISLAKRQDLRLLLGVLGCPLAPIPISNNPIFNLHIKNIPIETSAANYIIQQYLASTGCSKQHNCAKNMYTSGVVKMIRCETEISSGKSVRTLGSRTGENGCFVLWQMSPGMWSLELAVGGNKVLAGSDGKTVWRHTPWLGTHAAKGPQRPLRRIIQGLDPRSTARLFAKAQCLGEKRIGEDDCFVLKVAADRAAVIERSEGPAEVIRHVLYGYFSQKSGLLIYMEDSHLTRVQTPDNGTVYWETTIGSTIGDYVDVDGVLIAHQGRTIATVFRFGETSIEHNRTRMEEEWRIHDIVFNVPGLSMDSFIPPADILDAENSNTVSP